MQLRLAETPVLRGLALWAVLAACVLVYATPEPSQHWRSLVRFCDFGHVLAFGFTTFALFLALGVARRKRYGYRLSIVAAALLALGLGGLVELLQAASGGNGEWGDVLRDAGGAGSAAAILLAGDPGLLRWQRRACGVLAGLLVAGFFLPTARAGYAEVLALREFPLLVSFAQPQELERFESLPDGAQLVEHRDAQGGARRMLHMLWPAVKYPGFELAHFPGDWRGWRALSVELVNLSAAPLTLNVRLDDADYRYELDASDRYDGRFILQPGANRLEIPLAAVALAPQGRQFDLSRVRTLLVHGLGVTTPAELLLGSICLTP